MMYQKVDGGYAVFASKAGAPTNPDWYYNLLAHPQAQAEIGTDKVDLVARVGLAALGQSAVGDHLGTDRGSRLGATGCPERR